MFSFATTKPHPYIYRNATLLLISTMTVMAGATIAPSLPAMEKHFSDVAYSTLLVQLVMTIPGLTIALCAPFIGWFLDRKGRKSILFFSTLLYGVSGVSGFYFSDSLYGLLVGRVFLGVAVAGVMVCCTTLIGDYFEGAKRGKYMGLQAAFGGFGGVFFIVAATYLSGINWQAPFLIYGLAFLLLPCLCLFIEEPRLDNTLQASRAIKAPKPQKKDIQVALCYFLAVLEVLVLYIVPVHFPFYAESLASASHFEMGMGIALMILVMSCVASCYRFIQAYASFSIIHIVGVGLLALGFAFLSLLNTYYGALFSLTLAGVGLGLMRPNLVMWLMSLVASNIRGRVMGGLVSCFFIGQFLCPLFTYPIISDFGYKGLFIIVSLFLLFAGLLILLFNFCSKSFGLEQKNT